MEPFVRHTSPGTTDDGRLFVTVRWDGKRLSLTGVIGPEAKGDARGSCGQTGIPDDLHVDWWKRGLEDVARLRDVWDRWHLNDMRADCEHQRRDWRPDEPLELVELGWGPAYNTARHKAESGEMPTEEYPSYSTRSHYVRRLTIEHKAPKSPELWGPTGDSLIAENWLVKKPATTKAAGWVSPEEHPRGLLGKPCPECGYRYGIAWLHEDVPDEVLEFLRGLPDDSVALPAAWRAS